MRDLFMAACADLDIDVVASVGITAEVDLDTDGGRLTVSELAETVRSEFERANVKVRSFCVDTVGSSRAALLLTSATCFPCPSSPPFSPPLHRPRMSEACCIHRCT